MLRSTTTIHDWDANRDLLAARPYGVVETSGGQVVAVHLRWLPKLLAWPEFWPTAPGYHIRGRADRCLLYYNQPRRFPNFLALKYVVSTLGTSFATFRAALVALDRLAELKHTDALLCDAANARISDRLLQRWGWAPHKPQRWRRNYIKRFYGTYPPPASQHASPPPIASLASAR
jgi:hypothetical protein